MRLAPAALLALSATTATAQIADGIYESPSCTDAEVSETRIMVTGNRIAFYETVCELLGTGSPVPWIADAVVYDAACGSEGETMGRYIMLMPGFDGSLIRVESGFAMTYAWCGKAR